MAGNATDADGPSEREICHQVRCDVCHDLRLDLPDAAEWFAFPFRRTHAMLMIDYPDLKLSELSGCTICGIILYAVDMYTPERAASSITVDIRAKDGAFQKFYPLNVRVDVHITNREALDAEAEVKEAQEAEEEKEQDGGQAEKERVEEEEDEEEDEGGDEGGYDEDGPSGSFRSINLQLYEEQDHQSGLPTGPARTVSQHPGSSKCMDLLRSWLARCCDSHEACSGPAEVALPTRVVLVGSETSLPRLYIPKYGEKGPDIVDLERFQRGIPEETLPRTFLDAVYICRQLQIPFLWIDSFCIIQDDKEDWSQESSHMGSYYGGATLTIAADYARNSSEGCFRERPLCAWNSFRIDKRHFGLTNDIHVRQMPEVIEDELGHSFGERNVTPNDGRAFFKCPLNLRAWALQEWYLSRRIVHFTAHEMVWECEQDVCCECSIDQDPDQFRTVRKTPLRTLVNDNPAVYEQWAKIVKEFSMRHITYERDRLPAISGIAELFSKLTKDTYTCGVWKNFPLSLVWVPTLHHGFHRSCFDDFYAPSWSWVSIASEIQTFDLNKGSVQEVLAEILEVDPEQASGYVFGSVPYLKIRGPVFAGKFHGRGVGSDGSYGDWVSMEQFPRAVCSDIELSLDVYPSSTDSDSTTSDSTTSDSTTSDSITSDSMALKSTDSDMLDDTGFVLRAGDSFVVFIIARVLEAQEETEYRGLVLKAHDESVLTYRRIGAYFGQCWNATPEEIRTKEKTITLV
ncbi:hypothetical protein NUW58_g6286 [Xylaria curta]|uniref:Uncharacterized protein n=1 Tax=Xylaria curta TaxID=42375 RepID=A0ACC1NWB2_9PEZI|nr:hypothetical protein NUW58_g6286 [Xylaria curta]